MADLVRKTQFEKICPFAVLDELMQQLKRDKEVFSHYSIDEILPVLRGKINGTIMLPDEKLRALNLKQIASMALVCLLTLEADIKPDS